MVTPLPITDVIDSHAVNDAVVPVAISTTSSKNLFCVASQSTLFAFWFIATVTVCDSAFTLAGLCKQMLSPRKNIHTKERVAQTIFLSFISPLLFLKLIIISLFCTFRLRKFRQIAILATIFHYYYITCAITSLVHCHHKIAFFYHFNRFNRKNYPNFIKNCVIASDLITTKLN